MANSKQQNSTQRNRSQTGSEQQQRSEKRPGGFSQLSQNWDRSRSQ